MSDKQLPALPIKITREGEYIKFKYGDYTLRLKELDGLSQTYSGLLLDKFISEATTKQLKEEIDKRQMKVDVRKSLLGLNIDDTQATDNVIRQIHDDLWGKK